MSENDTDASQMDGLGAAEAGKPDTDTAKSKSRASKAKAKPAGEKADADGKDNPVSNNGFASRRVWPD